MNLLIQLVASFWQLTLEMAPFLLLGFLIAGVLHLYLPKDQVANRLSGKGGIPVLKAVLLGIPLPVCSCGVIPIAAHLNKQGAGKGPTVAFLASTPTTGVDSIAATYALLGPLFAVVRPILALLAGLLSGLTTNQTNAISQPAAIQTTPAPGKKSLRRVLHYALIEMINDVGKWILLGLVIGAVLSTFLPTDLVEPFFQNRALSYGAMLLLGLPLYVCATGSIPIAAAMVLKGLSPGGALIFLTAGPATNAATMSFVGGTFGKKTLAAYLLSIALVSLGGGFVLDALWSTWGGVLTFTGIQDGHHNSILHMASAVVLLGAIVWSKRPRKKIGARGQIQTLHVPKISCQGCATTVRDGLTGVKLVEGVEVDVATKMVKIAGGAPIDLLRQKLADIGYPAE